VKGPSRARSRATACRAGVPPVKRAAIVAGPPGPSRAWSLQALGIPARPPKQAPHRRLLSPPVVGPSRYLILGTIELPDHTHPRHTTAYAVNIGLAVEAGAVGTLQKLGRQPCLRRLAGYRHRSATPPGMRQASLGLLSRTNICGGAAGWWFRWIFGSLPRLECLSGVPLSDAMRHR